MVSDLQYLRHLYVMPQITYTDKAAAKLQRPKARQSIGFFACASQEVGRYPLPLATTVCRSSH